MNGVLLQPACNHWCLIKISIVHRSAPTLLPSIEIAVFPSTSHVESGTKRFGVPASYIEPGHCADSYKAKNCVDVHGGHLQTPSMDRHKRVETTARRWPARPMMPRAICQFEVARLLARDIL